MVGWNFPANNDGQVNGIADSGIETFNGTPIKSLAREICQNSLDARRDTALPARVSFQTFEIPTDSIPDIGVLQDALERSLKFWKTQEKAKRFFDRAIQEIKKEKITCLRISDYNTTGLTGSRERYDSPWCNLIKSSGASGKSGTNGGSFGIGKFAPYACSLLRTVFYSTMDEHGEAAYQGVSRLTSFENKDHKITQGTGFYGGKKNSPVQKQYSLDPEYTRAEDDFGTDIFVLAFNHAPNWKNKLVASILDGFLYAIYHDDLIVEVEDVVVCKQNLPELISQNKDEFEEDADKYYSVLTMDNEEKAPTYETDILGMGKVILKIMIEPDLHRKCAMVRKTGMKIMDRGYISGIIPFAGILYIEGEQLNAYLRGIENPQHTKWEIDRADNKAEAKRIDKTIISFIKESLEKLKKEDASESIDPDLGGYLAFEEKKPGPQETQEVGLSDRIKNITFKTVERNPDTSKMGQEGGGKTEVDDPDGENEGEGLPGKGTNHTGEGHGTGGNSGTGTQEGQGSNPTPVVRKKTLISIAPSQERTMCLNKQSGEYRIVFTPSVSAKDGYMELFQSAESQNYDALVLAASCDGQPLQVSNNTISGIEFHAHTSVHISIKLDYHDYCALEVKAYGHKV